MELAGAVDSHLVGEDIGKVSFPLFSIPFFYWLANCLLGIFIHETFMLFPYPFWSFFSFFKVGMWHGRATRNSHNKWHHHGIRFHISGNIIILKWTFPLSGFIKLTLYSVLVVKSNRSCHWFHWPFDSIWQCETGKLCFNFIIS